MKKKWFDAGLYRDGLRQLRTQGFLMLLILVLEAVLMPLGEWIIMTSSETAGGPEKIGLWGLHPFAGFLLCLYVPVMVLHLFRFLTERNASDFYHSIPQTRGCLFVSFLAAELTWAFGLQWGTTLLAIVTHAVFPQCFILDFSEIFIAGIQLSACILFLSGATALAASLTGNRFTHGVVSMLIIFVPRLLMLVVQQCVGMSLRVVSSGQYLTFLGNGWNVVTGTLFGIFADPGVDLFLSFRAGAYTAFLGVVYIVAARQMFVLRKSEAAGEAAVNRVLQLIFRLIPAAVFCLIPSAMVFNGMVTRSYFTASTIYLIFILYLVSVFLYFMYELMATRKVRNLPKTVPGLGFLVIFNLAIVFGMFSLRSSVLSFTPSAEEIDSVNLIGRNVFVWEGDDSRYVNDYFSEQTEKIALSNDRVRQLVATRLSETAAMDKGQIPESTDGSFSSLDVAIHQGGRTVRRSLLVTKTDLNELAGALVGNQELQDIFMDLPEGSDPALKLSMMGMTGTSHQDLMPVYDAFRQDVKNMGFEKWYLYCSNWSDQAEHCVDSLYMQYETESGISTGAECVITEKTPLAMAAYLQMMQNDQADQRKDLVAVLELLTGVNGNEFTISNGYCYLEAVAMEPEDSRFLEMDLRNREDAQKLCAYLKAYMDQPVDPQKGYVTINVNVEYYEGEASSEDVVNIEEVNSYSGNLYLPLADDFDTYFGSAEDETLAQ